MWTFHFRRLCITQTNTRASVSLIHVAFHIWEKKSVPTLWQPCQGGGVEKKEALKAHNDIPSNTYTNAIMTLFVLMSIWQPRSWIFSCDILCLHTHRRTHNSVILGLSKWHQPWVLGFYPPAPNSCNFLKRKSFGSNMVEYFSTVKLKCGEYKRSTLCLLREKTKGGLEVRCWRKESTQTLGWGMGTVNMFKAT